MTTYGTIPTSSAAGGDPPSDFISRAKELGQPALATRRPWREMAHTRAFGLPPALGEAYLRIRTNLSYFAMNYAMVVLSVVFLSLLWPHPNSLAPASLFFYFLIVVLGRVIGDKAPLVAVSVVTIALLVLTHATLNILVSLLIGLAVVVAHAALRRTEDLCLDEEAAGPGSAS